MSLTDIVKAQGGFGTNSQETSATPSASGSRVNFKDIGKSMLDIAEALPKMTIGLNKFKKANTDPFINFLDKTIEAMSMKGKIKSSAGITKMYTAFSDMFKSLGLGIKGMSEGLMMFGVASKLGQKSFLAFLDKLVKSKIFSVTSDKAADNAKAFLFFSKGIKDFAIGMAISTPLLIIGLPGFVLMTGMMFALSKFTKVIDVKSAKDFTVSMGLMAAALGLTTLAFFATRILEQEDIIKGVGILVGLGGMMFLVGKAKQFTLEGAGVMIAASIAMLLVTVSLKQLASIDGAQLAIAGGVLIGTIIAPVIVLGKVGKIAWEGIALLGAIGVSYFLLGKGISYIASAGWKGLALAGTVLAGTTAALVGLSFAAPFVALGVATLLGMGAALFSFGVGLKQFEDLKVDEDLGTTIYNIIVGEDGNGVGSALKAIGRPVNAFLIASGAAVATTMGISLYSMGKGLKQFQDLKIDYDSFGTNLASLITSITEPFKKIGEGGFFFNDTETGIEAIEDLGQNLYNLAKGVQEFANLEFRDGKGKLIKITDTDMANVGKNIGNMIAAIAKPFGEIGANNASGSPVISPFGLMFWPGKNNIQAGIEAIHGLGAEVAGIADGVVKMATFKFVGADKKIVDLSSGDALKNVGTNIGNMIKAIADPLAALGGSERERSWFWPGDTAVKAGIENIKGLGAEVGNIADAVNKISGMKVDVKGTASKLSQMLGAITMPFVALVNGTDKKGNKLFDLDDIADGAESVGKISASIKPAIENFTKIGDIVSKDPKFGDSVVSVMSKMVGGINSFAKIDPKLDKLNTKNIKQLSEIVSDLANIDSAKLSKNADSFTKIGSSTEKMLSQLGKIETDKLKYLASYMEYIVKMDEKSNEFISKKIDATNKVVETAAKANIVAGGGVGNLGGNNGASAKAKEQEAKMAAELAKKEAELEEMKQTFTAMSTLQAQTNKLLTQLLAAMQSPQDVRVISSSVKGGLF